MISGGGAAKIRLFAGPNGSGKTSLFEHLTRQAVFKPVVFINADQIERQIRDRGFLPADQFLADFSDSDWQKHFRNVRSNFSNGIFTASVIDSYIAAELSEGLRRTFLDREISFASETVFSHPSKLAFLQKASESGFEVYLYFIATETPAINLQRIRERVTKGGHTVPGDKVVERYARSLALLKKALPLCKRAFIFDNSGLEIERIAEYEKDKGLFYRNGALPNWVRNSLESGR